MSANAPRHHVTTTIGTSVAVLGAAAFIGTIIGLLPTRGETASIARYGESIDGCTVTDGDTIRCGDERIRLLGIDAPEMPDHCRVGRNCVAGDPDASAASLSSAMTGALTIERVGQDDYGRTLAVVAGSAGDLSCWQLRQDQAIYKSGWDNGRRVAHACPAESTIF
jgi:micrococcal nuclease